MSHPCWGYVIVSLQAITGDADPLYVVEVLVHCSKESVKNTATEAAKPAAAGEKGEMQVGTYDGGRRGSVRNGSLLRWFLF